MNDACDGTSRGDNVSSNAQENRTEHRETADVNGNRKLARKRHADTGSFLPVGDTGNAEAPGSKQRHAVANDLSKQARSPPVAARP